MLLPDYIVLLQYLFATKLIILESAYFLGRTTNSLAKIYFLNSRKAESMLRHILNFHVQPSL